MARNQNRPFAPVPAVLALPAALLVGLHGGGVASTPCTAQDPIPRIVQRIIQGEETSDYPSVGIVGSQRNGEFCTGTLISRNVVMTAAHCAEVIESGTSGTFRLGQQVYLTSDVAIHPDYNSRSYANDIALLRLSEPVLDVEPSAIFRGTPVVGDPLLIVGFGGSGTPTEGSNGDFGTKRVGLTFIDEVTETLVNWNFDDPSEANTAPGDSGGPGFLDIDGDLFVAAITSGGTEPDAILGDFAFNTRVDAFADWIDANLIVAELPVDEAPTDETPTEGEPASEELGGREPDDCDLAELWCQPFPFLQFMIQLLTSLYEQLTGQSDDGISACPAADIEPEADPGSEPAETDEQADETSPEGEVTGDAATDQPSVDGAAPSASRFSRPRSRASSRATYRATRRAR